MTYICAVGRVEIEVVITVAATLGGVVPPKRECRVVSSKHEVLVSNGTRVHVTEPGAGVGDDRAGATIACASGIWISRPACGCGRLGGGGQRSGVEPAPRYDGKGVDGGRGGLYDVRIR